MMPLFRRLSPVALLALSFAAGCRNQDPENFVRKGTAYFDQAHYAEAIVEFRRAIQLDPKHSAARVKLAEAFERNRDAANALREYVRAADLLPDNADIQLRAGSYLLLAQQYEDAKGRADRVLAQSPANVDALILRGNALAGLADFDGAVAQYEDAIAADPARHEAFLSLGAIQSAQRKPQEAEATFKKAVAAAPREVAPGLALANFLWSSGRPAEAESALKAALAIQPENPMANRALGVFYMATGRTAEAEDYFKALAATTGNTTGAVATLAQYYATTNRRPEARKLLEELAKRSDARSLATVRLAALDAQEGQTVQGLTRLKEYLAKNPNDTSALLLSGELLARDGKRDEGLAATKAAIAIDPSSYRAHDLAGQILAQSDRPEEAIQEYEKALRFEARPLDAALQLARLHLARGAADKSATYAQQALALDPRNAAAQSLLIRSYLRGGDRGKAKELLARLRQQYPNAAGVFDLTALVQLAEKQTDAARASYLHALQLNPKDLEALAGVVTIDLSAGRVKDATARIDGALAERQLTVDLLILGGRAYATAGDLPKSEAALKRAIDLEPSRLQAYHLLGELYVRQNRIDEALKQFRDVLQRNSKSVGAGTMVGMLLEAQGHRAEAEKEYERVLEIDSRAGVAANNLAWLYLTRNAKLDEALQLAATAQQALPEEPTVNDTLGWAYVKKNMASRAIGPLEAGVQKSPGDAVMHYHLGVAYMQTGEFDKAKRSLTKALELKPDFEGAQDARKTLASIGP
jgi:tetratricopeptide (TPR) repeat protein